MSLRSGLGPRRPDREKTGPEMAKGVSPEIHAAPRRYVDRT